MVRWSIDARDAKSARRTRLEFVEHIHRWYGPQADAMAAELVLGELIGNVARYAPGPAHVQANFDKSGVTIAVRDSGRGFSAPAAERENNLLAESGRGLAIVSRLAEKVEVECPDDNGCCVRARLDVRRKN